jgi:hypothetical protein
VIDLHGPMVDPQIINRTNGDKLVRDGLTIADGEFLRVYTAENQLMMNDAFPNNTGFKPLESTEEFRLSPGDNVVEANPFSASAGSSMVTTWQDTFG